MKTLHAPHTAREPLPVVQRAAEMLNEHHLVAWSRNAQVCERFALELAAFLHNFADTQVCTIPGWHVRDLDSFCTHLEAGLAKAAGVEHWPAIARKLHGRHGVIDHLRRRGGHGEDAHHTAHKRRYYIWRDADALLRKDSALFGELVDALTGVAAEAEYVSEDLLFLHRAAFVGGPALDLYAQNPQGQFCRWLADRSDDGEAHEPLWRTITGVSKPPVAVLPL